MKVIAVTNDRMSNQQLVDTLLKIEPFIDAVILREKSKADAEIIDLIQKLRTAGFDETKIIVHSRTDIASITRIKKVQLPGYGLPLTLLKKQFPDILFGKSVHSYEEAEAAYKAGADWILYGHLFATNSKNGFPPRGTEELSRITTSHPIPVYAIGGIKPQHLSQLQQTGVAGISIMSAIFECDNPEAAAKAYQEASHFAKR
jgi:thiazole tautomerase (transcriptional regulator TenI)